MRAWAERGLRRAEEEKAAAAERAKAQKKKPVKVLSRRAQRRLKAKVKEQNQPLAEKWQHKQGTPETLEKASHTQQGALARLFEAGYIDREQLEWADEIATVAEQIQSEVAVRTASLEARVDNQAGSTDRLYEGIKRARFHVAYATWRERVPQPKGAAIEMLTGDRIPYSTAARRYRMGRLRMKKLLIEALDLWPDCKAEARRQVDPASHAAFWAGLV